MEDGGGDVEQVLVPLHGSPPEHGSAGEKHPPRRVVGAEAELRRAEGVLVPLLVHEVVGLAPQEHHVGGEGGVAAGVDVLPQPAEDRGGLPRLRVARGHHPADDLLALLPMLGGSLDAVALPSPEGDVEDGGVVLQAVGVGDGLAAVGGVPEERLGPERPVYRGAPVVGDHEHGQVAPLGRRLLPGQGDERSDGVVHLHPQVVEEAAVGLGEDGVVERMLLLHELPEEVLRPVGGGEHHPVHVQIGMLAHEPLRRGAAVAEHLHDVVGVLPLLAVTEHQVQLVDLVAVGAQARLEFRGVGPAHGVGMGKAGDGVAVHRIGRIGDRDVEDPHPASPVGEQGPHPGHPPVLPGGVVGDHGVGIEAEEVVDPVGAGVHPGDRARPGGGRERGDHAEQIPRHALGAEGGEVGQVTGVHPGTDEVEGRPVETDHEDLRRGGLAPAAGGKEGEEEDREERETLHPAAAISGCRCTAA